MRSLVKYNPSSLDIFRDFDRVFDSFFSDSAFGKRNTPRVDIREHEDGYVLEAELPGLTEKDVEVKVDDNLLTISSKTEEDKKEEGNGYLLRERRHTSFARSFVLPKDVDKSSIEARFSNGLLSLNIAKAPETKPKTIEVKSVK
jgi:HSP20 family molecular chaperone IbpA